MARTIYNLRIPERQAAVSAPLAPAYKSTPKLLVSHTYFLLPVLVPRLGIARIFAICPTYAADRARRFRLKGYSNKCDKRPGPVALSRPTLRPPLL